MLAFIYELKVEELNNLAINGELYIKVRSFIFY